MKKKNIGKILLVFMLLFSLNSNSFAFFGGGGKGSGKILKKILEYVEKNMTANVKEQIEQIARWQQQIEQWEKELAQKVGLGDLELKKTYEDWQNIYKDAQSIYSEIEQMSLQNVLDYKKFANLLLETKSNMDTESWEKTEEQMKDWKKKIDKMEENTAKAKEKFTGQLLNISSEETGKARRNNSMKNASSSGATDKQIQQKILNALASIEQLTIEQNEILASKELVAEQVNEVAKQSEEAKRQEKQREAKEKEDRGAEKTQKDMEKFGSTGKKIGFY